MSRDTIPTFVTELPLRVTDKQASTMLVRFDYARQLYNACLGEGLRRLALIRQSKAYQSACYIPKTEAHKKERTEAFGAIRKEYKFTDYDLQDYGGTIKLGWIGSSVVQKVATRAFNAVNRYSFGKAGRPRFKSHDQFDSLEGKQNSVISWNGLTVTWGGLVMIVAPFSVDSKANDVLMHGLDAPVKYVRIVRRKLNGKNRFYVQLVNAGIPFHKAKNTIGQGLVGIDIGPSTIAIAAPTVQHAELKMFCNELKKDEQKIRRLQRKQDRQRRANNPQNYNPDKTIKTGAKEWHKSLAYQDTQVKLAETNRKLAEYRESLHGQLVNQIVAMGNEIKMEELSYRAFQKRYGKSVGMRAPGKFVNLLKRKAASAGVSVTEFSTRTTKLSQVCLCGSVKKKPLSQRWHTCECGVKAQRDLFSALLAACVKGEKLNADLANYHWQSGMETCLRAALSEVQPAIDGYLPVTFGLGRSQSGSPVKVWNEPGEIRNVVASVGGNLCEGRESEKACSCSRTPRLSPNGAQSEPWGVVRIIRRNYPL